MLTLPEKEHRGWKERRDRTGAGERLDAGVADRGEVIRRRRAERCRELRTATRGQLVGVQLQSEPRSARGDEDLARFVDREHARLAEHVGESGEPLNRDRREHLMDEPVDVLPAAAVATAELKRHLVSAEPRRYDAHRQRIGEPTN